MVLLIKYINEDAILNFFIAIEIMTDLAYLNQYGDRILKFL